MLGGTKGLCLILLKHHRALTQRPMHSYFGCTLVLNLLICGLVSAQTCSNTNTNLTSGYNSGCPNGRPYCLGECAVCTPYHDENYYCDCPTSQGCRSDPSSVTFGTCGTMPKYGQSCSVDGDCSTTYQGSVTVNLPCVSGKCRICDPSDNVTHVCDARTANGGKTMVCVSPGVWSTAGSTATASSSTSNAATATTQGSTGTTTSEDR